MYWHINVLLLFTYLNSETYFVKLKKVSGSNLKVRVKLYEKKTYTSL